MTAATPRGDVAHAGRVADSPDPSTAGSAGRRAPAVDISTPTADRRCTATSSRTGERCRRWAATGCNVCRSHGAAATQVRRAAERRIAREKLEQSIGRELGNFRPDIADPAERMLEALARAQAMVDVIESALWDLGLTPGGAAGAGMIVPDHLGDPRQHELLGMYADWIDRVGRLSKAARLAGVEERRVEISGQRVAEMTAVLRGVGAAMVALLAQHVPGVGEPEADMLSAALPQLLVAEIRQLPRVVIDTSGEPTP